MRGINARVEHRNHLPPPSKPAPHEAVASVSGALWPTTGGSATSSWTKTTRSFAASAAGDTSRAVNGIDSKRHMNRCEVPASTSAMRSCAEWIRPRWAATSAGVRNLPSGSNGTSNPAITRTLPRAAAVAASASGTAPGRATALVAANTTSATVTPGPIPPDQIRRNREARECISPFYYNPFRGWWRIAGLQRPAIPSSQQEKACVKKRKPGRFGPHGSPAFCRFQRHGNRAFQAGRHEGKKR